MKGEKKEHEKRKLVPQKDTPKASLSITVERQ